MKTKMIFVVAGLLALGTVAACGQAATPTSPTSTVLAGDLQMALQRSLQDEYRAEAIYQGVVTDLGKVLPFVNVLTAEERHSASIERLYTMRGLIIPVSDWTVANVPRFATVQAACLAGVTAERENIAIYDDLLRSELPADVRQVFTNNRSASLVSHLPAFERCS
jgi:hypothetical protein